MIGRRDLLLGAGIAAFGACARELRAPSPAAPDQPVPSHWPPYRDAIAIDGAGGINLVYPDDMAAEVVAGVIAADLGHAPGRMRSGPASYGLPALLADAEPEGHHPGTTPSRIAIARTASIVSASAAVLSPR